MTKYKTEFSVLDANSFSSQYRSLYWLPSNIFLEYLVISQSKTSDMIKQTLVVVISSNLDSNTNF